MEQTPCTLSVPLLDAGFFSNFNNVMSNLRMRLGRDGMEAVKADWIVLPGMWHFGYAPVGVNAWELFFEPFDFPTAPGRLRMAYGFPDNSITDIYAYRLYKTNRTWRHAYGEIYRRHIRMLPFLTERVAAIVEQDFAGRRVIGVHARHPGHSVENLFDIPPAAYFIERTRNLIGADAEARIFLATDAASVAEEFRKAFGERLIVQAQVERSTDGRQVHQGRDSASMELAAQVIVDAMLLARCDALLHVTSNIATAAGYMNPDMPMIYCETPTQRLLGQGVAALMGNRVYRQSLRHRRQTRAARMNRGTA